MRNIKYTVPPRIIAFLVTPLLLIINIGWIVLAGVNSSMAAELTKEDNILELLQFFFLVGSALFCLRIFLFKDQVYDGKIIQYGFLVLFVVTLFVALEEISWGQRIFQITTPDFISKVNQQNEINFHNHMSFQRYRHWLMILFGGVGLMLIYLKTALKKMDSQISFFTPSKLFKLAFLLILVCGVIRESSFILKPFFSNEMGKVIRFVSGRFTEIGELGVAITAFSYAADKFNSIISKDLIRLVKKE